MLKSLNLLLDVKLRRQVFLVLLGTIVAAAFEMFSVGAIPAFVVLISNPDRLLALMPAGGLQDWARQVDHSRLVLVAATALATAFLLKNTYVAFLIYRGNRVLRDVTVSLSNRLFRAYVYSPYTFHLQRNPAQLINNITNESGHAVEVIGRGFMLIRETLVLVVLLCLLVLIDPLVSLAVFVLLGGVAGAFYFAVRRSLIERGLASQGHQARLLRAISQGLGAIKDAKILGRESFLAGTVNAETSAVENHELYRRGLSQMPRLFLEVLAVTAIVVVAVLFVALGRPVETMLPVMTLLAVAVVRLVPAFNMISSSLVDMRFIIPGMHLTVRELELLEPEADRNALAAKAVGVDVVDSIRLRDVAYRYPGAVKDAVSDITLDIRVGDAVALVGPSGAGKTTLIDVILGLLTPTHGRVLVDDLDIQSNLAGWQRQIGYIPQDIYLLDDSIRRNIAFGLPDEMIDDAAVLRALEAAQLSGFVAALPEGLDTTIGNRGIRLSGGERQRLGIARSLYHNPSVLVMDEATSALDNQTEREVIAAVTALRGDRTIIMIAHRLTTVKDCDRLFLIIDGELRDAGTYSELAERHQSLRIADVVLPADPVALS